MQWQKCVCWGVNYVKGIKVGFEKPGHIIMMEAGSSWRLTCFIICNVQRRQWGWRDCESWYPEASMMLAYFVVEQKFPMFLNVHRAEYLFYGPMQAIQAECERSGVICSVVGVPKSIDNDILLARTQTPVLFFLFTPWQHAGM